MKQMKQNRNVIREKQLHVSNRKWLNKIISKLK